MNYYTQQDKESERRIIGQFRELAGLDWPAFEMPDYHDIDFVYISKNPNGNNWEDCVLMAWAEVKVRKNPISQYKTVLMPLMKWLVGLQYSLSTNVPFLYIVQFADCLKVYKQNRDDKITFAWGGRKDRNKKETQIYAYIPRELFIYPEDFI